jgi:ubiquinone/menaquinone biosynthesis C-methylase UbiE
VLGGERPAPNLPTRFLIFFFYLIYEPLAWSYDLVAWVVSLGRWKSWIYSTLPHLPGPCILELGHGPGHLQVALSQAKRHVIGVDLSRQMGRIAYKRLSKFKNSVNLVRATAEFLPFPRYIFDQVVATFPSEYIVNSRSLAQIRRTLLPEGKMVVLPVAWIRGNRVWDRAAAWLFRATGQAAEWNTHFTDPLHGAGFSVAEKRVELPGSEVMLLIAHVP